MIKQHTQPKVAHELKDTFIVEDEINKNPYDREHHEVNCLRLIPFMKVQSMNNP